jgi:hypothetical protein
MTLEQWTLGCFCLVIVGFLVHALVTGRSGSAYWVATRSGDPAGYWLTIGFLLLMLALTVAALGRVRAGQAIPAGLFATPLFLYGLVETLRTGEARSLSKEPFRRSERPAVYWTHVLILALLLAFSTTLLARDLLR